MLAAVSVIAFGVFGGGGDSDSAAATTTSEAASGDGTTTVPDGATTTTVPGTDTSVTLPDGGTDGAIPSVGDPIPLNDLKMSADDIGPLDFGDDGDEVLGRLVATFGQPTDDTGFFVGSGSFGECPGDGIRVVRWGPLNVVIKGQPGDSEFVSYRLDLRYGGLSSDTTDISTLSGLRVSDTVEELTTIYASFYIEYVVDEDAGLVFVLKESQNAPVLLWGPVESQAPDARVTGIYSPNSCQTQAATG